MLKNISRVFLATLIVLISVSLSVVYAQDWYAGGGVAGVTEFDNDVAPMATLQVGATLESNFGFRGSVDSKFSNTMVNADALYNIAFPETTEFNGVGYVGLGPSASFESVDDEISFEPGLHATVGVESRQEAFGVFAELQPAVFSSDLSDIEAYHVGACVRLGLNFHF